MKNIGISLFFIVAFAVMSFAQTQAISTVEKSPAYRILVLEKFKLSTELQNLRMTFREMHPDVKAKRTELDVLSLEMAKVLWIDASKYNLLTETYGKLILEKITAEKELRLALNAFRIKHPDIQRKTQAIALAETNITEYLN